MSVIINNMTGAVLPPTVDIIITMKTHLSIVQPCVESILRNAPDSAVLQQRIIFVDDGSPIDTVSYENNMCSLMPSVFKCLSTPGNARGYTRAVVKGINFGTTLTPLSKVIVLLNSDTITTEHWLDRLYEGLMFNKNHKVKIVGPLSNAASYQSIPYQRTYNSKDWATNPLPVGLHADQVAIQVASIGNSDIRLDIMNGFCFMFRRDLIHEIGNFDTKHFAAGYGEEVDFSMRAFRAGFQGRIVSSAYVYHRKTASFQSSEKAALKTAAKGHLNQKYGRHAFNDFAAANVNQSQLALVRKRIESLYRSHTSRYADIHLPGSLLFILPEMGTSLADISDRTASIIQEVHQMRLYGVNASVALPYREGVDPRQVIHALLPSASQETLQDMVIPFRVGSNKHPDLVMPYDVIVATHYAVMDSAVALVGRFPQTLLAYYVQEYSPWTFSSPYHHLENTSLVATSTPLAEEYMQALRSFTCNDKKLLILSTSKWTCGLIKQYHGVDAKHVLPSLDHHSHYPNQTKVALNMKPKSSLHIATTLKPAGPQKNAVATLHVMLRLLHSYPHQVRVTVFNCQPGELDSLLRTLQEQGDRDSTLRFKSAVQNKSITCTPEGAHHRERNEILQSADTYVDMSYWLAFPTIGLEALAAGCVSFLPATGGASSLCRNGKNCFIHDSKDTDGFYLRIARFVEGDDAVRHNLIQMGMKKSWDYTIEATAAAIASLLKSSLKAYRQNTLFKRETL